MAAPVQNALAVLETLRAALVAQLAALDAHPTAEEVVADEAESAALDDADAEVALAGARSYDCRV
jgi:hypothetical protein